MSRRDRHLSGAGARTAAYPPGGAVELYGPALGPGAHVGGYVIEAAVARGGFATVYRARHGALGRVAALKLLHPSLAASPAMLRRFRQEALTVNRVRHPNIVDVYELGELHDGRPYLVMEWIDGRGLDRELGERGPLTPVEALALLEELGGALAAVHRVGVVHRDLKGSNVLIARTGQVKLVDFGIAKLLDDEDGGGALSSTGARVGTPSHMAPEQIRGQPVDARTDLYALGVLLFHMLTGRLPFSAASAVELEELHLHAPPPRPGELVPLPPALDAVIVRCLDKSPVARYPDVAALLAAARRAIEGPEAAPALAAMSEVATGSRAAGAPAALPAFGLHVELRLPLAADAAALAALDAGMTAVEAAAAALGLQPVLDTANMLLGVTALPADAAAARVERRRLIAGARALAARLASLGGGVSAALALHAATLVGWLDATPARVVGGELLCLGEWLPPPARAAAPARLVLSAAAAAGLEDELTLVPLGERQLYALTVA